MNKGRQGMMGRISATILAALIGLNAVSAAAFMYEDDPDFTGTRVADLPEAHADVRYCAEHGVSECQVIFGDLWSGKTFMEPSVWNLGEGERWYRAAAMQGHRRGIAKYARSLCWLNSVEPRHAVRRAIDSLAWRGLVGGLDIRAYFVSPDVENCDSVNELRQMPDYTASRVIKLVRARANEIRAELTAPLHGWNGDLRDVGSADDVMDPPGGWTTIQVDGRTFRIRALRGPPGWENVRD